MHANRDGVEEKSKEGESLQGETRHGALCAEMQGSNARQPQSQAENNMTALSCAACGCTARGGSDCCCPYLKWSSSLPIKWVSCSAEGAAGLRPCSYNRGARARRRLPQAQKQAEGWGERQGGGQAEKHGLES